MSISVGRVVKQFRKVHYFLILEMSSAIMTLQRCNIVMFQFVFTEISCFILKFCF